MFITNASPTPDTMTPGAGLRTIPEPSNSGWFAESATSANSCSAGTSMCRETETNPSAIVAPLLVLPVSLSTRADGTADADSSPWLVRAGLHGGAVEELVVVRPAVGGDRLGAGRVVDMQPNGCLS